MTFRFRLVAAATVAVLIVVVLGAVATYVVAYNSLVGSTDTNLLAEAQPAIAALPSGSDTLSIRNACTTPGSCSQVVYADGTTNASDPTVLPVTATVRASAASQGKTANQLFSTTVSGLDLRELVVALPPGYTYRGNAGYWQLPQGGALQVTAPSPASTPSSTIWPWPCGSSCWPAWPWPCSSGWPWAMP